MIRAKLEEVKRLLEEVQMLEAKLFVRKVKMIYAELDFDKDFEEFWIKDDDKRMTSLAPSRGGVKFFKFPNRLKHCGMQINNN